MNTAAGTAYRVPDLGRPSQAQTPATTQLLRRRGSGIVPSPLIPAVWVHLQALARGLYSSAQAETSPGIRPPRASSRRAGVWNSPRAQPPVTIVLLSPSRSFSAEILANTAKRLILLACSRSGLSSLIFRQLQEKPLTLKVQRLFYFGFPDRNFKEVS